MKRNSNDPSVMDFDLGTFQSEVYRELEKMRSTLGLANFPAKNDPSVRELNSSGLFAKAMLAFVSLLKKRAKNYILNDREFIKKERVASRIVSNPEIKKILCPRLRTDVESDTFEVGVRARLVEVVTSLLTEDRIAKEFAIARDPRMFSLIVLKILQLGIINYCKENVVEESLD